MHCVPPPSPYCLPAYPHWRTALLPLLSRSLAIPSPCSPACHQIDARSCASPAQHSPGATALPRGNTRIFADATLHLCCRLCVVSISTPAMSSRFGAVFMTKLWRNGWVWALYAPPSPICLPACRTIPPAAHAAAHTTTTRCTFTLPPPAYAAPLPPCRRRAPAIVIDATVSPRMPLFPRQPPHLRISPWAYTADLRIAYTHHRACRLTSACLPAALHACHAHYLFPFFHLPRTRAATHLHLFTHSATACACPQHYHLAATTPSRTSRTAARGRDNVDLTVVNVSPPLRVLRARYPAARLQHTRCLPFPRTPRATAHSS